VADSFDEIAKRLQDAIFEGYSQRLKEELFNAENIGAIENPDGHARITGVCGDTIEMSARIQDKIIRDIQFVTDGCGFTVACANYVARTATGKTVDEALGIEPDDIDRYFEGLPDENKHCAKLAVMTFRALIDDYHNKLTG
jgi:nitrogen fixation NifU-like protein